MSLTLSGRVHARNVDLELHLGDGERLALLGPNGAGKSTLLALLAGVLRADSGRAELDGRVLFDIDGRNRRWIPPHERGVALMAQDPLLFPHLTVAQNVAFGPRAAGRRRAEARQAAQHWLEQVDAAELSERKPAQLSGGQAQRVAIARALAAEPRLLLLDEPLSALDVGAAPTLRRVLRRVLAERAAILVTHDLLDAVLLCQQVVVLDRGRVVEAGPTSEVIRHPRTPFTARIAGLNLLTGVAERGGLRHRAGDHVEGVTQVATTPGEPAVAVFGPEAVAVFAERPQGSPRNVFPVVITELEPHREQVRLRATFSGSDDTLNSDVTTAVVGELDLYPGKQAFFAVKAAAVRIYPN